MALVKGITKKLRSPRGASIIMALLLFMVCAIVGTVVLTAGTAAAGRASQLAAADQRYFSVTSATELLAKKLTGVTYTVTRTETVVNTATTNVLLDGSGNQVYTDSTPIEVPGTPSYSWDFSAVTEGVAGSVGKEALLENPSLLVEAALRYILGGIPTSDTGLEAIWNKKPGDPTVDYTQTWRFSLNPAVEGSAEDFQIYPVYVTAELKRTGDLVLTVSAEDSNELSLELNLTLNVMIEDDSASPINKKEITASTDTVKAEKLSELGLPAAALAVYDDYPYTDVVSTVITTKVTNTKTTSISWTVHGVNTTVSGPAS